MAETDAVPADGTLVDHHCHGVLRRDIDAGDLAALLTEGSGPHTLDSATGLALRRHCAPVLDLPEHAPVEDYLARRAELGWAEVTARLLRATGTGAFLVDTGFEPEPLTGPAELAAAAGATAYEVVRLERLAEEAALSGVPAAGLADEIRRLLWARTTEAVAVKSIAAYRVGLDLDPAVPTAVEVSAAAGRWLAAIDDGAEVRCADPVLSRLLIWAAVERGLPLQVHVGLGDRDLDLRRADPLGLTGLLRATEDTGMPVLLLHNYPYQRSAGYLAQVFTHVYVDVGLALHNVGPVAAGRVLAELLELAPFGKVLFSTDAYALPELFLLGTLAYRGALARVLGEWRDAGELSTTDAGRIAEAIGAGNARRVYRLPD